MNGYVSNRCCNCQRCWWRGAMGPAVMVTLGVLFLLSTLDIKDFHYTWPILLIVIGVVKILQYNASMEGHLAPGATPPPAAAAGDTAPKTGGDHV